MYSCLEKEINKCNFVYCINVCTYKLKFLRLLCTSTHCIVIQDYSRWVKRVIFDHLRHEILEINITHA